MSDTSRISVDLPKPLWADVKQAAKDDGKFVSAKTAELLTKGLAVENEEKNPA